MEIDVTVCGVHSSDPYVRKIEGYLKQAFKKIAILEEQVEKLQSERNERLGQLRDKE